MTNFGSWVFVPASLPEAVTLNPAQLAAAQPSGGVRVVLGGPGTGKTTVLVESVLRRLAGGSNLERLIVLSANRAAAQDLRRQIIWRQGGAEVGARITTVHGFALGLLRELGDPNCDLRLLRAPEQEQRLRDLLEGQDPKAWPEEVRAAATTRGFSRQLREVLARARQLGLDPETVVELAGEDEVFQAVGQFFELYLTIADFDQALDYTELVHRARLLLTDQRAAAAARARFDAVLVDDAQELDQVSAELLSDLARLGLAVWACGDPQQRLGSFRGASAQSISLLRSLPGAQTLQLTQGYRNRSAVAEALGQLRSRLSVQDAPEAPSPAPGAAGQVTVTIVCDQDAEVAHLATQLRLAVTRDGLQWRDLAVIVRSGRAQLTPLARHLELRGIPVEVAGDELALGSQRAVQALLNALSAATSLDRLDAATACELILGPLARVDAMAQRRLARALAPLPLDLPGLLADPERLADVAGPEAEAVSRLAELLRRTGEDLARGSSVSEAMWQLWSGTEWPQRLRAAALAGNRSAHQDLDAVVELFELANRKYNLAGTHGAATFRAEVAREEIPADTGRELSLSGLGVRLLTAHRARSGTWQRVFIVGLSEGTWPTTSWRGLVLDPDRLAPDHLDAVTTAGQLAAERRSFYVACSRASSQLHISAPAEGTDQGPPSRFCWELGVAPQFLDGSSPQRQTPAELVAELRQVAADETQSPVLRRAAAMRLAQLGRAVGSQGGALFPQALPNTWWGVREPSSATWLSPKPFVITGSGLKTLLACPRLWFLTRKASADRPRGTQASVGELIHLIAQQGASQGLPLPELLAQLEAQWSSIEFPTPSQAVTEKREAIAALTRFANWHHTRQGQLLGVEVDFEVSLVVAGRPVKLRGTVDRLEVDQQGLEIVDLKTGRQPATKAELAEHEQLGIYQLAARLGAFETKLGGVATVAPPALLQLRHGQALPLVQLQEVLKPSPNWLDAKLERAVAILESGEFEARQNTLCSWCVVRDSCPARNGGGDAD